MTDQQKLFDDPPAIDRFQGEYRWLSNFHEAEVMYDGIMFPTNEHAFQATKANNFSERLWVLQSRTPGVAKRRGRKVNMRPDWEQVKIDIMYEINRDKFSRHPELREKLLATGRAELIEGNDWGDTFWGVCDGKGKNNLGRILMNIRLSYRV